MNKDEFLEVAKAYKKLPCPVCQTQTLIYTGYTFIDGDMAGQLHTRCKMCDDEFDVHVHSLENSDVLH